MSGEEGFEDVKSPVDVSSDDSDDSDGEGEQFQYKVVILGDGAVGKTSVAMRFCEDYFAKQYKQTIGLDFFIKRIILHEQTQGKKAANVQCAMQIWDIGGQQVGSKMIGNYIHQAHAILFTYDVTSYQSFQNLEDWYALACRVFEDELPYMALVANKTDQNYLSAVRIEKHRQFAADNNLESFFVSAKTGDSVQAMFTRIAADLSHVKLTKSELEGATKVVEAEIVNHPQNDPDTQPVTLDDRRKCLVQ